MLQSINTFSWYYVSRYGLWDFTSKHLKVKEGVLNVEFTASFDQFFITNVETQQSRLHYRIKRYSNKVQSTNHFASNEAIVKTILN